MPYPHHRANLIAGLRALADFIEANPAIPAPYQVETYHFPEQADDAQMCAEIDAIAARLGSSITANRKSGHYSTMIRFGPVTYKAVAVLAAAHARLDADRSYHGCVQPDTTTDTSDTTHAA